MVGYLGDVGGEFLHRPMDHADFVMPQQRQDQAVSRQNISSHDLRRSIAYALSAGREREHTRAGVLHFAREFLRGQGIRAKPEELEAVLNAKLGDILLPPCDCIFLDDTATPAAEAERRTEGPHHVISCPAWRSARTRTDAP